MNNITPFFNEKSPLSNWHPSIFVVKGITFCCMEQFMMYCKAKLFKDEICAAEILKAKYPAKHKSLGRLVSNYDDAIWSAKRESYVKAGCLAKFSQNVKLYDFLIQTGDTILVEASRYDKIWGAGIDATDPRINDPSQWPGLNLLGKVLMDVRQELLQKDKKLAI